MSLKGSSVFVDRRRHIWDCELSSWKIRIWGAVHQSSGAQRAAAVLHLNSFQGMCSHTPVLASWEADGKMPWVSIYVDMFSSSPWKKLGSEGLMCECVGDCPPMPLYPFLIIHYFFKFGCPGSSFEHGFLVMMCRLLLLRSMGPWACRFQEPAAASQTRVVGRWV